MISNQQPSFLFENFYEGIIAGIDEAGCGPWAGPVVAAAVIIEQKLFPQHFYTMINDSKKISKKKREAIYKEIIQDPSITYGIGSASVEEIDAINIAQATFLAKKRAIGNLSLKPDMLLIDGKRKPNLDFPIRMIIRGDQQSYSIAAASIIAKVTRDKIMTDIHSDYPFYGWIKNAGYGTAQHQFAMKEYGITVHHRKTYAPVKILLEKN